MVGARAVALHGLPARPLLGRDRRRVPGRAGRRGHLRADHQPRLGARAGRHDAADRRSRRSRAPCSAWPSSGSRASAASSRARHRVTRAALPRRDLHAVRRGRHGRLDAFAAHVAWLAEAGLDGVFVAGTTGEGVLLEDDEVAALVERAPAHGLRVIAQVGRPSTRATARLPAARSSSAPTPSPPTCRGSTRPRTPTPGPTSGPARGRRRHARLPLQHPAPHGQRPLAGARRRARRGRLRGHEGLHGRLRAPRGLPRRARGTDFELYIGSEPLVLRAYRRGAAGAITGLAGARPELFVALREALAAGDDAAAEQARARSRPPRPRSSPRAPRSPGSSAASRPHSPSGASPTRPRCARRSPNPYEGSDLAFEHRTASVRSCPYVRASRSTRTPASPWSRTSSPPRGGWPPSWASRACSPRCSCAAGWATPRPPARSWRPPTSTRWTRSAGLREAAARILGHVARRSRITVHGDYDVDGICSSAVLIRVLRTLGADVDWYLPEPDRRRVRPRRRDGGPAGRPRHRPAGHRGLRDHRGRGGRARPRRRDGRRRHRPPRPARRRRAARRADRAPAHRRLPVRGPVRRRPSRTSSRRRCWPPRARTRGWPTRTWTSSRSPRSPTSCRCRARTAASCAPGLRALASTRKPGLRALMDVARVDPSTIDASAIGFRLGPRLNAAGRLYRADAGLELLLTEDRERARAVAQELDAVNSERRDVETRIRFEAEAQVAEQGAGRRLRARLRGLAPRRDRDRRRPDRRAPPPPGGADRARRRGGHRLRALDPRLRPAGRPARRLARRCSRYGGHRAAAGLTIARADVAAFREAFAAHAASVLTPEDLRREVRVDAVAPGDALTLGARRGAGAAGAVRAGQPARLAARPSRAARRPAADGRGPPRRASRSPPAAPARAACCSAPARGCPPSPASPSAPSCAWRPTAGTARSSRGWCSATPTAPLQAPIEVVGEPEFRAGWQRELDRDLRTPPRRRRRAAREVVDRRGTGIAGLARRPRRRGRAGAGGGRPRAPSRPRSCATAWAASRSAAGTRWPTIRRSPRASRTSSRWTRRRARCSTIRPGRGGPIWRGVSLS